MIALVVALLLSQTAAPKKPTAKVDDWGKRKECAAQAEKVMLEFRARSLANGGHGETDWSDHYSPKYNRCYLKLEHMVHASDGGGRDAPMLSTMLVDAFERAVVAQSASVGPD